MQSQGEKIFFGQMNPNISYSKYNHLYFVIQQLLNKVQTATIVKVVSCTNEGDLSPVGFVDVIPQVNQIDGGNNSYPHGTIHNIPYMRIQGGSNAIIIDPVAGDLGICVFANRDISNVKSTKKQSSPGSFRKFDFADGMYLGGLLNNTPVNYIQFQNDDITIKASAIHIIGDLDVQGSISSTGDISGDGTSLHTHTHSGVQTGGDNTGPPN